MVTTSTVTPVGEDIAEWILRQSAVRVIGNKRPVYVPREEVARIVLERALNGLIRTIKEAYGCAVLAEDGRPVGEEVQLLGW
jgi:hypothetical protein